MRECGTTFKLENMAGQISKNTKNRPNKIFAAKPLLKTTKFSEFGRKKAKFSTLCWICPFKLNSSGVLHCALCCVQFWYLCSGLWCTYGKHKCITNQGREWVSGDRGACPHQLLDKGQHKINCYISIGDEYKFHGW